MNKFYQGYMKLNSKPKQFSNFTLIITALIIWTPILYGIADYVAKH